MQRARRMPWAHWQWPSWEHLGRTDGRPGGGGLAGWVRDHHRSVAGSILAGRVSGACRGAHVIHLLVLRDQSAAGTEGQQGIPSSSAAGSGWLLLLTLSVTQLYLYVCVLLLLHPFCHSTERT